MNHIPQTSLPFGDFHGPFVHKNTRITQDVQRQLEIRRHISGDSKKSRLVPTLRLSMVFCPNFWDQIPSKEVKPNSHVACELGKPLGKIYVIRKKLLVHELLSCQSYGSVRESLVDRTVQQMKECSRISGGQINA